MKRIVFVDDEIKVLEGLKRMLRPLRNEWNMAFVDSGAAALQAMDQEPFDVVVTDIRMPGMDGVELLTKVSQLHPQVVRIVLSGHSDRDLTLKSVTTAHQCLSKPCDSDILKATISRAIALQSLLVEPPLKSLLSQLSSLPSIPSIYLELTRVLENPEATAQDVGSVVARDTAMTARVLQIVNSPFFGMSRRVANPKDAVVYLGFDTVRALVLSTKVFSLLDTSRASRFRSEAFAKHSVMTGMLARKILKALDASKQFVEDSLMAGLLHDVGKLVLVAARPQQYDESLRLAQDEGVPMGEAERQIFGTTHAEVGTYLLWLWGFPDPVIEAVAYHHKPAECPVQEVGPLTAVYIANALDNQNHGPNNGAPPELDHDYLEGLGLANRIEHWRADFQALSEEGGSL